jgi:putative hydrolase of the HAD superfamily
VAIRGVLFDWGGTIVRNDGRLTSPAAAVAGYLHKRLQLDVSPEDFDRALQAVIPEFRSGVTEQADHVGRILGQAFTWMGVAAGANDVDACARLFFDEVTQGDTVFDDARALLASLRYRGFRCGVVTNSFFPASLFTAKINQLGMAGYFDSFVASADVGLAKPNPGPFHRGLSELGLGPEEALFVGDTVETDIVGARAAGMRAVLLERSAQAKDRAGFLVIERLTALNDSLGESGPG